MYNLKYKRERGFALLIAVVVSAIILTISISIVNSALREVILASTVRKSLESFYMADSGAECALYWDNIRGNFEVQSVFVPASGASTLECMGYSAPVVNLGQKSTFWLRDEDIEEIAKPCVNVDVKRNPVSANEDKVVISSWGFNTCDETNDKRVDRALEVKYSTFR